MINCRKKKPSTMFLKKSIISKNNNASLVAVKYKDKINNLRN